MKNFEKENKEIIAMHGGEAGFKAFYKGKPNLIVNVKRIIKSIAKEKARKLLAADGKILDVSWKSKISPSTAKRIKKKHVFGK